MTSNFTATSAPGVSDDSDSGYKKGSVWLDISSAKYYVCESAGVGAASWTEYTGGGGGTTLPAYLANCYCYWPLVGWSDNRDGGDMMASQPLDNYSTANTLWEDQSPFTGDKLGSAKWGTSSKLRYDNKDQNTITDTDFSWSIWARPNQTASTKTLMSKSKPAFSDHGPQIEQTTSGWQWNMAKAASPGTIKTVTSTISPASGRWDFIVGVYDSVADEMKISVNDETFVVTTGITAPNDPNARLTIGARSQSNDRYFAGHLRDAAWWRCALTAGNVTDLYGRTSFAKGW